MPLERAAIRSPSHWSGGPYWELERLSVGYGKVKQTIDQALSAVTEGYASGVAVCERRVGDREESPPFIYARGALPSFPCARVDLNARSTPLNYPQRFSSLLPKRVLEGSAGAAFRSGRNSRGR